MIYYKTSSLVPKDEREKIAFLTNEYGHNFGGMKKEKINKEKLYLKTKNIVNKDFVNRNE